MAGGDRRAGRIGVGEHPTDGDSPFRHIAPGDEEVLQSRRARRDLAHHVDVVEAAEFERPRVGDGTGKLDQITDFRLAVGGQRHHRQRAELEQRERQIEELRHVVKLHQHPIAGTDAERRQVGGDAGNARPERPVADALIAGHDRDALAAARHPFVEMFAQRPALPIALAAVVLRDPRRVGYEAFERFGGHGKALR